MDCEECGGRVVVTDRDEWTCDDCGLILDEMQFAGVNAPLWPRGRGEIHPTKVDIPLALQADIPRGGPPWTRRYNLSVTNKERKVLTMLRLIKGELTRLNLPSDFAPRVLQICKKAVAVPGRKPRREFFVPAVVLVVARERHIPILYRDLHATRIGRKSVMKVYRKLAAATLRPPTAMELVGVLAEKMHLPWEVIRAANVLVQQFLKATPAVRPLNVAAVSLYVSARRQGLRWNQDEVPEISPPTLRKLVVQVLGRQELDRLSRGKGPRKLFPPTSENVSQHS